ncbi:MAG: hypothetical protein Q9163_003668 [Psora crenata]
MTTPTPTILQLQHIHLLDKTPYLFASLIQSHLVRQHLDHKASSSAPSAPSPNPTLLTFQTRPTYTCGRREISALSDLQIAHLRHGGRAAFHEALRGGQTTFHGPGQLTAYLICDLHRHGLNARTYIRLLEESVMGTCKEYGLETMTYTGSGEGDNHAGVWIQDHHQHHQHHHEEESGGRGVATTREKKKKKLASVGVHLRRNVSSHGVGLNVSTDLQWFERITACGLPGGLVTNMEVQLRGVRPEERIRRTSPTSSRGWGSLGIPPDMAFCSGAPRPECSEAREETFQPGTRRKLALRRLFSEGALHPVDVPVLTAVARVLAREIATRLEGVAGRVIPLDAHDVVQDDVCRYGDVHQ